MSDNFAEVTDLLGGLSYSNIDSFDNLDYNLLDPNSTILEGDKFKYHYEIDAKESSVFAIFNHSFNKIDFYLLVFKAITF